MKLVVWLLLVGLVFGLGCGGKATVTVLSEPVKLAYKDVGGQAVQYKMTSSVTMNLGGSTTTWVSDITYSAKVESIYSEGTIARRITFDDFSISTISGGRPEPDEAAAGYKGQYLWLKLGPAGQIVDWKGLDKLSSYTAEDRNLRDVLVQQMATLFQPLPADPVNVGSKWQSTVEIPVTIRGGDFKQKVKTDYEVSGFGQRSGRNCAKILVLASVEGEGSGTRGADRKFWVEASGLGKGEMWFDYENGLLVEYGVGVTADQTLNYERAGKADVATEFATIDSQSKIRLVK